MPVTYGETRAWVYWLNSFTVTDLAEAMAVTEEAIEGFLIGLMFNGTIEDTGARINGTGPEQPVYSFVPLPPGPRVHPHRLPAEIMGVIAAGGFEILTPRGMPVRIRTERDTRRSMSTPGARGRIKRREERYERMQQAIEQRKRAQAERQSMGMKAKKAGARRAEAVAQRRRHQRLTKAAERFEY